MNQPSLTPEFIDHLMSAAIQQAGLAATAGEVPVGAVIAHSDTIIVSAQYWPTGTQQKTSLLLVNENRGYPSPHQALQ